MKTLRQILDEKIRVYELLGRTDIDQLITLAGAIRAELEEVMEEALANDEYGTAACIEEFLESDTIETREASADLLRKELTNEQEDHMIESGLEDHREF